MAGNAVVGALRVILGIDTAALDKGLKDARGSLKGFAAGAATIAAGIGLEKILEKAAGAFTHAIKQGFEAADKLGKSAQKIGIPVEELAKLGHAADLSGVSMESLEKGVGKLSQTIAQSAGGAVSDATRAFAAMGISVKDADGSIRPTTQIIEDLAGKFANMKDGAGKTALAMQIFGKSGKDLIPLLNEGKDGLRGMFVEAEKLGLVISKETVAATTRFNDDMRSLQKVGTGVSLLVTAQLAPAFSVLAENIKKSVIEGDLVKRIAAGITDAMMSTISIVSRLGLTFVRMSSEISGAIEILKGLGTFNGERIAAGWETISKAGKDYHATVGGIDEAMKKFLADAAARSVEWAKTATKGSNEAASGVEKHKNALEQFIASQRKSIAGQQAELQTIGLSAGAKDALKVKLQGLQVATDAQISVNEAYRAKLLEVSAAAGEVALKLQGAQLVQANLAPGEAFRLEMENNRLAMVKVKATSEELARQGEKDAEKFGMSWSAIGTNIAGTAGALSNLTGTFAKENKAMGIASKAFGIGQAIINTQIAITKALATLPPPASYAAVAFAVAQGAAAVASISMQKFVMGGRFKVPGGVGGGDRVPVSFMAEAGELVEVSSNRAGGYRSDNGGGNGGAVVNVHIQGREDYEYFGRLIEGVNRAVKYGGYRLEVQPA